ncbi:PSME3-interacting protein [Trichonephila inaurata madagascariensis]|uniref:PSME3-interacting protein n=1 Tax=Trichonephila inaurata madagascariensis TaxID=2747483 RepID=A0A8X6X956_9ARAC|nr:PSME3-interacting protein [Trichonephila inaurata madagascariensis]
MSDSAVKCKKFITESEIEEIKKKRQEEWEKVRKHDDPEEAPEEEYDPRSLFDRLQEQKDLKQSELEESRRLKNLIKGLDDDEVAFLELVDQTKMQMETRLWEEEKKEIQEFRRAVSTLSEEEEEAKLQQIRRTLNLPSSGSSKKSQQNLLVGALKRKASSAFSPEKKEDSDAGKEESVIKNESDEPENKRSAQTVNTISCLGILPGLNAYNSDSSDSENSSDSEVEKENEYDLVGRRHVQVRTASER